MGYVNIDLWNFPEDVSDEELREQLPAGYEGAANAESIAIGPVLQDPTRTFTHGAVHRMDGWWDIDEEMLSKFTGEAADAMGQWIGYRRIGKWLGLRVVDFDMRGIDRERGCLVIVRPDQFVAHVVPLDGHDEIAAFFAPILLAPAVAAL